MLEFIALAQQCAPTVAPQTMAAIVNVESSYNPYAIGVVKGRLQRQPKNIQEAVATAKALAAAGWNFSIGIAQVNRYNLPKYNLTYEQGFEPCSNLWAGSKILEGCFIRADNNQRTQQEALKAAISCYYSNNFTRGFKPDVRGKPSYVEKVVASAEEPIRVIPVVPAIQTTKTKPQPKPEPPTTEPPVQLKKLPSTEGSQDELQQENTKQDDVVVF
jgi:type IV secretion system protein VirB1